MWLNVPGQEGDRNGQLEEYYDDGEYYDNPGSDNYYGDNY